MKQLIEQYELAKKEIASSKQMLADAMRDLDVTRNAKESLGEQVKALVAQYNQARQEIAESKKTLEDAMKHLQGLRDEKMTLSQQVIKLSSSLTLRSRRSRRRRSS